MLVNRILLVLLSLLLCIPIVFADLPIVQLDRSQKSLSFTDGLIGCYIDTSMRLTIDDLQATPSLFGQVAGSSIFPSAPQHVWMSFQLQKDPSDAFRAYLLEISNAHLGYYEIYFFEGDKLIKRQVSGDNFPFTNREVRHNFFVHNLPASTGDVLTVIIKVNQEGQEVNVPIQIYERNYFIQRTLEVKIFHGLIIGLFLITSIVTLFLYFIYKERFFLYEVIVSFASIFYILAEEGYGLMLLWPSHPYLNGLSRPLSMNIVVIFSLLFTIDFLKIKEQHKTLTKLSYIGIGIYVLFMILAHPFDIFSIRTPENIGSIISIFLFTTLLGCLLIAGLALLSWIKEKNNDGMVVFLVFAATLVSILVRLLALQGWGSNSDFVQHTGFITRGIHIPLIGGYLIYSAIKSYRQSQELKITLLEEKNKSTKAVIESIDAERQRISMALHDSAGSIITGIKANLQMIQEDYQEMEGNIHYTTSLRLSDQLQEEVRNISNDLLPSSIIKLGLVAEVKSILRNIENTYGIKTTMETNQSAETALDQKILFHLYYIIREALDNIIKYANAQHILVQYFIYEDEIHLLIEDDGIGFDYKTMKEKGGNGLRNMELRVAWLHGTIDTYSKEGTSISINIPVSIVS